MGCAVYLLSGRSLLSVNLGSAVAGVCGGISARSVGGARCIYSQDACARVSLRPVCPLVSEPLSGRAPRAISSLKAAAYTGSK